MKRLLLFFSYALCMEIKPNSHFWHKQVDGDEESEEEVGMASGKKVSGDNSEDDGIEVEPED